MEEVNTIQNVFDLTRIIEHERDTLLRIEREEGISKLTQEGDFETRLSRKEIYYKNLCQLDLNIAIQRQLGEDAKARLKQLDIEWINQQLMEDHGQKIDPQAKQLRNEKLARQHHSGLLLINGCVDLLEKQKDLQLQFKQLSQLNINLTNTDIDTDMIIEGSISVESNLVDTHLTHVKNKLELPSSNTVRHQNVSVTNAAVVDTILNQTFHAITGRKIAKIDLGYMVRNLNVRLTNAAVHVTILKLYRSEDTLRKITKTDLGYIQDTLNVTVKEVILQMLVLFRFRSTRFGTRVSMIELTDFLMTSLTSLPFDGGGRIRMMTSCTSMPFDGGGWI